VPAFGRPYRMVDPGLAVKRFPSQYPTHWSIEAALAVRKSSMLTPDEIVEVEVVVGANNESAVRAWPTSGLDGKFCLAYTVAAALLDGRVVIGTFRDERLARDDMGTIRPKIRITLDPTLDAMDFSAARSTVRVTTARRGILEATVTRPLGIWDNPLGQAEREAKFDACAEEVSLPEAKRTQLKERLRALTDDTDVAGLLALLRS